MELDPHQLIEGVLLASYAVEAKQAFIYVRGEMAVAQERLAAALNEAYAAGLVGRDIAGSGWSMDVLLHWGAGAYIVGEETALIESLEGRRGMPRLKPPYFPAVKGLYMQPTIVNNVETLANIPWIVANGGAAFAALGTEESTGMRLFALSGHVQPARVYEVEMGRTTFRDLIEAPVYGGGIRDGGHAQGVHPRWRLGPWFYEEHLDLPLSKATVDKAGLHARLRRGGGHGPHHRRGQGVRPGGALLRPRVVRQVHAVPGGHHLAAPDPAADPRR
jgi:NADH-quinone oxidoreductase subunit F